MARSQADLAEEARGSWQEIWSEPEAPTEEQTWLEPSRRRREGRSTNGEQRRKKRSKTGPRKPGKFEVRGSRWDRRDRSKDFVRRAKRRKRVFVGAMVFLGVVLAGLAAADAYLQSYDVIGKLEKAADGLKGVRSSLLRGTVPQGDPFTAAQKATREAEDALDAARPDLTIVGYVPLVGLPVQATQKLVDATRHELNAALVAKDLLETVLGHPLDQGTPAKKAKKPAKKEKGKPKTGVAKAHAKANKKEKQNTPNAILDNGRVHIKRLQDLGPQVEELATELGAAEALVTSIPTVPFSDKVKALKDTLVSEAAVVRSLAERGLTGLDFIPKVFGQTGKRTYLLLFSDPSYLRGTGGVYFGYAEFTVDHGSLSLVKSGPIIDLDRYHNEPVPVPKDNWYLRTFPSSVRMANLNWDPNFPSTAKVARSIYQRYTGHLVDGVFQIDVPGVADLLTGLGGIHVAAWPSPISGHDLVRIALIQSYEYFRDQGLTQGGVGRARKQFNSQLVSETWKRLQAPKDLVKTVFGLSQALAGRHLQMWTVDKEVEAFISKLGWSGSIKDEPGDYAYVVDDNLGGDKLDVFTYERLDYDVNVREDGTLDVTAHVRQTNAVDTSVPYPVVPNRKEPVKRTYVHLYAPAGAKLHSVTFSDRFHSEPIKKPLVHDQAGKTVFSARMNTKPQETAELVFRYTVPNGLVTEGGKAYRLLIQRQPRVNVQSIQVQVTYPKGWSAKDPAPEWTFEGNTATYAADLPQDLSLILRF